MYIASSRLIFFCVLVSIARALSMETPIQKQGVKPIIEYYFTFDKIILSIIRIMIMVLMKSLICS